MEKLSLLLLDDDENTRRSLSTFLSMHGYRVKTAASPSEALAELEKGGYHLLLTDVRMPEMNGIALTEKVKELFPDIAVLVMTAYGNVKDAVTAMKGGAFNYLTKPLDQDELLIALRKVAEYSSLVTEVQSLRRSMGVASPYENIIGGSEAMGDVYRFIAKAAANESSVLITGETGSGKEVVARAIHLNGPRRDRPLVALSCGALPETLIESELFGHIKGAFTGAVADRAGRIRTADGGTLFLDEIATLSPSSQIKLLRVLEEKKFEPLGGDATVGVDIRVIAATNEDLSRAVEQGRFRKDLYYRLNVLQVELPPLRTHKEDIPLLARHILQKLGRERVRVSSGAMNLLLGYDWPGNVRELENVIESSVASMQGDLLMMKDLPDALGAHEGAEAVRLSDKVGLFEKQIIAEKLKDTRGNIARAARDLGCPLRSFRRKLAHYSINQKLFKRPPGV
jgi:DNA-binding NtrC family response regulator